MMSRTCSSLTCSAPSSISNGVGIDDAAILRLPEHIRELFHIARLAAERIRDTTQPFAGTAAGISHRGFA